MYMRVYMSVCMCTCESVCVYVSVVCECVCTCVRVCVCMRVCMCMSVRMSDYLCTHALHKTCQLTSVCVVSSGTKAGTPQPLVQWMEVTNHPGLVCCMTQTSNNPVILMVKPDAILVQEIRVLPPKAKVLLISPHCLGSLVSHCHFTE